jgi:hypothetical protein
MIDPAVLGTALIGLERIRSEQALTDPRPARRRSRPASAPRLAHAAAAVLRGLADAIDRTWPAGAATVSRGDVEYHPVPTRL